MEENSEGKSFSQSTKIFQYFSIHKEKNKKIKIIINIASVSSFVEVCVELFDPDREARESQTFPSFNKIPKLLKS